MADKNNSRRAESSIKRTRFLGHLGLIAGVFRELEVDNDNGSLLNDLFNCRMEIKDKIRRRD